MKWLSREQAIGKINDFAQRGQPFVFVTNFLVDQSYIATPEEARADGVEFSLGQEVAGPFVSHSGTPPFEAEPIGFDRYREAFDRVMVHLRRGDTYLLNLTFATRIHSRFSLHELYVMSRAPYKLRFADRFIVFSPEAFVRISDGVIRTHPMKGTIDASLPDAGDRILSDKKEYFEHNTIVDLLRNDLSMISTGVKVIRFRYIDTIRSQGQTLLQVSSEIGGNLAPDYRQRMGDILFTLLPAGSVSGAPKQRTIEIIKEVEEDSRGFYTGIFGHFDGRDLNAAVMIRYIEQRNGALWFRSGGGITALSDARSEYMEMIQKVTLPAG